MSGLEFTSADLYKVSYINLDEESRIRVILFVKRMKGYKKIIFQKNLNEQKIKLIFVYRIGSNEIEFDTDAFVMRPLPLFETISNHVYHNSRSTAVRKKTFELEQKVRFFFFSVLLFKKNVLFSTLNFLIFFKKK